jgi:hypothetical protein
VECPHCGRPVDRSSSVEGLCSACLLALGLTAERGGSPGGPEPGEASGRTPERFGPRGRSLSPAATSVVAPVWAMPAELLRQASRRLRLAAMGLGLGFAVAIVLDNLFEALGWHQYSHLAMRNVVLGAMVAPAPPWCGSYVRDDSRRGACCA